MKILCVCALVALLSAVGLAAAVPLSGYLDWVQPVGPTVALVPMRAAGWVFDCRTGQIPGSGTGLLLVDGVAVPALFTYGDARPDVRAAFAAACPAMTAWVGFHVDFYATPGPHQLDAMITAASGVFYLQQQPF